MKTYKFTNASNAVVHVIDEDGISRSSCSIENPDYLAWLAEGNTPEPADLIPEASPEVSPIEKLRNFLAANPDVAALL